MKKKKKYDLIYVPAETYMLAPGEDNTVRSFIKLDKPAQVLLLGVEGQMLSVLHENKKWFIEKKQMRGNYDQFN
tara:strand:- start:1127 stop:1348 length:222 start_codon:yes stop_codon:yes gene_type:complete